jgi:hypothetical protein
MQAAEFANREKDSIEQVSGLVQAAPPETIQAGFRVLSNGSLDRDYLL